MAMWIICRVLVYIKKIVLFVYDFCTRKTRPERRIITDAELSKQAVYLCEKYTQDRFSFSRLPNAFRRNTFKETHEKMCSDDIVKTLCDMGKLLENAYPKLYSNVTDQLNFTVRLEIVVCGMFNCVCDNILATGITWARIVALYAFAAALASDCCQAGDARIAKSISKWMGQYTNKRLCRWIRDNGGWDGLTLHFCEEKYCIFVAANKWIKKLALPLFIGTATGLAGLFTLWLGGKSKPQTETMVSRGRSPN